MMMIMMSFIFMKCLKNSILVFHFFKFLYLISSNNDVNGKVSSSTLTHIGISNHLLYWVAARAGSDLEAGGTWFTQ